MTPNEATAPHEGPEVESNVTQLAPPPRLRVVKHLDEAEADVATLSARVADAIEKNKPKPKPRKKASPKPKAAKVDPIVEASREPLALTEEQVEHEPEHRTREEAYEALFDPHEAPPAPITPPPRRSSWFRRFVSAFSLFAGGSDGSDNGGRDDDVALRSIAVREPIVPVYLTVATIALIVTVGFAWVYG